MRTSASTFSNGDLIHLYNDKFLVNQRKAGKVAANALILLENEVKNGTTKTMKELDVLAENYIRDNNCIPTFKGYKGFPNSVCISINNQLVHGINDEYVLKDGDLVSFDLGATYNGAIGDTATTCIYGTPKSQAHIDLLIATENALKKGIEAVKVGKRIGVIGHTIHKSAGGKYGVITRYGGHGLQLNTPHAPPFVSNRANQEDGIRIQAGMTIAIEPLFVLGHNIETTIDQKDGWTVSCKNICSHFEKTIFIHEDKTEIITENNNDKIF